MNIEYNFYYYKLMHSSYFRQSNQHNRQLSLRSSSLKKQYYEYPTKNKPTRVKTDWSMDQRLSIQHLDNSKLRNINQINNKIKNILHTLNQHQQHYQNNHTEPNQYNKNNMDQYLSSIRKKYGRAYSRGHVLAEVSVNSGKRESAGSVRKEKQEEGGFTFHEEDPILMAPKQSYYTPQKNTFQTPTKPLNKSITKSFLHESRDLDAQINKIQEKINSFQEIKRKLNIDDKQAKTTQPYLKTETHSKHDSSQIFTPKPFLKHLKKPKNSSTFHSLHREIESQVIQDSYSYYKQQIIQPKDEVFSLIQKFRQQIEHDQKFRNMKKWFQRRIDLYKWAELKGKLHQKGLKFSDEKMKELFQFREQEDNPFFTLREGEGSLEGLILAFIDSQLFWDENIEKKFCESKLKQQGLEQMDIRKTGTITIEDIVRYINIQSDSYYRNRDLSLIYLRIASSYQEIPISKLYQELCRD